MYIFMTRQVFVSIINKYTLLIGVALVFKVLNVRGGVRGLYRSLV